MATFDEMPNTRRWLAQVQSEISEIDVDILCSDYVQIRLDGPQNLMEIFWLYLYCEGLINVPVYYDLALLRESTGRLWVSILQEMRPLFDFMEKILEAICQRSEND